MSNLAKLNSLSTQLKQKLEGRIKVSAVSTYTVVESSDAQGPILLIKDGSLDIKVVIRYKSMANAFTDVLGNTKSAYAPTICQIIEEGSATASTVIAAIKLGLDWELARQGCKAERYAAANPTEAMMVADGTCTATYSHGDLADYNWPQSGQ